ncbi:hypothetical protein SHIRM173S_04879 [Streptomyces hirsutus]
MVSAARSRIRSIRGWAIARAGTSKPRLRSPASILWWIADGTAPEYGVLVEAERSGQPAGRQVDLLGVGHQETCQEAANRVCQVRDMPSERRSQTCAQRSVIGQITRACSPPAAAG